MMCRNIRVFLPKFIQSFNGYCFPFMPATSWTHVIDHTRKSTYRVTIHRMVYRSISDSTLFHTADHCFKCFRILCSISIQLHITDMSCIGQCMVRCLNTDFLKCTDRIIYRYMERIGVILSVRHTRDLSKAFLINADKSSGQTFCRCGQQGKLRPVFSDSSSRYFLM